MTTITLTTFIDAPVDRCFDLARSVDLHMLSAKHTGEQAVAGRTSGIAEKGDTITWQAKHFGITQQLTGVIEEVSYPYYFSDRMLNGAFKSMFHEHFFEQQGTGTLMTDRFCYETPYWLAGWVFDRLMLRKHMTDFLLTRNEAIKSAAEGSQWEEILKQRGI